MAATKLGALLWNQVRATTLMANGGAGGGDGLAGTPEDRVEALAPYASIGYQHLIADVPAPHVEESITRLVREVRPKLADG